MPTIVKRKTDPAYPGLEFKYKRPTLKELGHTDVWWRGEYIGYLLPDRSPFRPVDVNYRFVSKHHASNYATPDIASSNRRKVIKKLFKHLNVR